MNRVKRYTELIDRLRRLLPADQTEVIALEITEIAGFSDEEVKQAGIGSSPSPVFCEAMPDPSRRNVYSPRTQIAERR